jgi:tellurite resistance protein TerC
LVFIGVKMLIEYFDIHIPVWVSLSVIIVCLVGSIVFSLFFKKVDIPEDVKDDK